MPHIVPWNRGLVLGIDLLDKQHKEFLQRANLFLVPNYYSDKRLDDCLSFLNEFVQYHFQTEESYMSRSQYPLYREHQARHSATAIQLKFLTVKLKQRPVDQVVLRQFYDFLSEWVQQHLMSEDLDFCRYYLDRNDKINQA